MLSLGKNPFFLRDLWTWKRTGIRFPPRGRRALVLGAMGVPPGIAVLCDLMEQFSKGHVHHSAFLGAITTAAVLWLAAASWCVVSEGTGQYHRDRDLGALPIVSVTAMPPLQEVWGRWGGLMIGALESWLLGALLVIVGAFADPGHANWTHATVWAFSLPWLAALGAVALICSASSRTPSGAVVGVALTLMLSVVAYLIAASWLVNILADTRHAAYENWAFTVASLMPPSPLLFNVLMGRADGSVLIAAAILWIAFVPVALRIAASFVASNLPLRLGSTPHAGPKGLMPAAPPAGVFSGSPPPPRPVALATPGVVDRLLPFAAENPFYRAYRSGFMRVYAHASAAPGSVLPPALMICGLMVYTMAAGAGDAEAFASFLVGSLVLSMFVSLFEGLAIGSRALSAERDQDTWPLLVVTGMSPARVLQGKFAMAFYAMSGEWTWVLPFWAIALLVSHHPGLIVMAALQPACMALGILCGLSTASHPSRSLVDAKRLGAALVALVTFLWLIPRGVDPLPLLDLFNPTTTLWLLAATSRVDQFTAAMGHFTVLAAVAGLGGLLLWRTAESRLGRVMRGE